MRVALAVDLLEFNNNINNMANYISLIMHNVHVHVHVVGLGNFYRTCVSSSFVSINFIS
jgi:hypothetical protein